jgi:general secretion pathway protein K
MPAPTSPRGAALLIVMVSIAIVTAISVDLAYQTRVSLQLAADARDELRATALAKSALNVSRLVLHFQQQLDGASSAIGAALGGPAQAGAQGTTPAQPAPVAGAAAGMGALGGSFGGIRLWELVPVNSAVVPMLLGGAAGAQPAASEVPPPQGGAGAEAVTPRAFGDFEGSFSATIEDEERKVNVRQLNAIGAIAAAQALRIAELVKDPKYDFLFDRDDANGLRVSRAELLTSLKDWADEDEVSSTVTGDPLKPFESGHGDENVFYDRLDDRYEAKNAGFDSPDELYQVAGVSDAFMAAFGDQLTVFPDVNARINVNATSPAELLVNALVMSDPPGVPQPALLDPAFTEKLQTLLAVVKPLPFLSITPQQFAAALAALGVKVHSDYLQAKTDPGRVAFTDRSSTFRIRATGQAGSVTKEIQAVVLFDRRAGPLAQDLGRVVHWQED